ncbi:MAG: ATP-binding cassette domain-containing protein [Firmicutes bacterium]|nr:ATP-binding cassette domain-containing protein [Bacillota bacterium]
MSIENKPIKTPKIPKVIHYVWIGGKELGEKEKCCIETWKKFCPDYEIMCHNEDNFDFSSCPWALEALEKKRYAFAADAIRLWALYTYGGIYLDTDVYLVKGFDDFLYDDAFLAYESSNGLWLHAAIIGSVPHNSYIRYLYSYYNRHLQTGASQVMPLTLLTRRYYQGFQTDGKANNLVAEDKPNLRIYRYDVLGAKDFMTGKLEITDNTVAVHDFATYSSWHSKGQRTGTKIAKISRKLMGRKIFRQFERLVKRWQIGTIKRQLKRWPLEESEAIVGKLKDDIIVVKDLYKSYGNITAVNGINFSVKRGELFTFLGVNGAGKSTTINVLCSLLEKDSGTIKIDGLDFETETDSIKKKIGIVFQHSVLDGKLKVLDNLNSRAALYNMSGPDRKIRIELISKLLHIDEILNRKYETLSGGQRRRVDIARALIHEPKILFLDEPTTGLDPGARIAVWQIIEKLVKEKRLTVFLTTHYMDEVTRTDSVVIIDEGRIVASGTPDSLKNQYTTDFLRIIEEETNDMNSFFLSCNKKFSYKNNAYYVEFATPIDALEFINQHSQFTDFEILKGDMDDVFLAITGKKLEGDEAL